MLGRVPEKFEQAAANEFSSATRNLASAFRALRERRRIGNLHLHGRNGRHGDVATIERRRNQSEAARFRGNVDWKPIASSEFFVEFDEGANSPKGISGARRLQNGNAADKNAVDITRYALAPLLCGKRKDTQPRHREHCDQTPLRSRVM